MFTGIVEELGKVKRIDHGSEITKLYIDASKVVEDVNLGDSIATNGICLTVTEFTNSYFVADAMNQTMRVSALSNLQEGDQVNLERALTLSRRLGGHIVSGHVDCVGEVSEINYDGDAIVYEISFDSKFDIYVIEKGSITIDGVSLTVSSIDEGKLCVSIIPHTQKDTIITNYTVGKKVNLEFDVIAKYVENLTNRKKKSNIESLMKMNGFM